MGPLLTGGVLLTGDIWSFPHFRYNPFLLNLRSYAIYGRKNAGIMSGISVRIQWEWFRIEKAKTTLLQKGGGSPTGNVVC